MFNGPTNPHSIYAQPFFSVKPDVEGKMLLTFTRNDVFNYAIKLLAPKCSQFSLTPSIRTIVIENDLLEMIRTEIKNFPPLPSKPYILGEFRNHASLAEALGRGTLCKFQGKPGDYLVFSDIDSFNLAIKGLIDYDFYCDAFRVADNPLTIEVKERSLIELYLLGKQQTEMTQEVSSAAAAPAKNASPSRKI